MFALQYGGPTMFFRDRMPEVQKILALKGLCLNRNSTATLVGLNRLDLYFHQILLDAMGLCALFNNDLHNCTLDLETFQEIVISLCYSLLRFRSLNDSKQQSDMQAAYHIGLTIFMMTVFLQYDRRRILDYNLIPLCLREFLDSRLDELEDEAILWLMIVGGIWISGDDDREWLAPRTRMMAQRLGIDTWDEVRSSVSKFPWINALHDEPGRSLWNRLRCG